MEINQTNHVIEEFIHLLVYSLNINWAPVIFQGIVLSLMLEGWIILSLCLQGFHGLTEERDV